MIFEIADWRFSVDIEATHRNTVRNASGHCECAYCKNYYEALPATYPGLCAALARFGIDPMGPCELMPFTPSVMLACYRINGTIRQWGIQELAMGTVSITPEAEGEDTFLLWVGELELPWTQQESPEEVVSPANLPEFLERMQQVWQLRHGTEPLCS